MQKQFLTSHLPLLLKMCDIQHKLLQYSEFSEVNFMGKGACWKECSCGNFYLLEIFLFKIQVVLC